MNIALFGGSFSPPGNHDIAAVEALGRLAGLDGAPLFDRIVVLPCGPRPDKEVTNDLDPTHRAALARLAFRDLPRCVVDLDDLEEDAFTTTSELVRRLGTEPRARVWIVVREKDVRGGRNGASEIERAWHRGSELWATSPFVVIDEGSLDEADLPPNARVLRGPGLEDRGAEIRRRAFERAPIDELVTPAVAKYLRLHRLYLPTNGRGPVPYAPDLDRPLLVVDGYSERARAFAAALGYPTDGVEDPTCIIVLGGDGTMMRAIREHAEHRVPFIGLNAGHRGFHLNEVENDNPLASLAQPMVAYHLPMLRVSYRRQGGEERHGFAYQDVYLRDTGAICIETFEDGERQFGRLMADAAIVALPVGSTAYAAAGGAQALPADAGILTFAVSGYCRYSDKPYYPRSAPLGTTFTLRNLQPGRRHPSVFADGVDLGPADEVTVRASRTLSATVAYLKGHDLSAKLRRA